MKCPNCNADMIKGEARLDKSWLNFMIFQYGATELFFYPDTEKEKIKIMSRWSLNRAFHCPECQALLIAS